MSLLEWFSPAAQPLVAALLNTLLLGVVLAGGLVLMLRRPYIRQRVPAATRHTMLTLVLAALLVVPFGLSGVAVHEEATAPVPPPHVPAALRDVPEPPAQAAPADAEWTEPLAPVAVPEATAAPPHAAAATAATALLPEAWHWPWSAAPLATFTLPFLTPSWTAVLFLLWCFGMVAGLLRLAFALRAVRLLKRQSTPLPADVQARMDALIRRHGLRRPVRFGLSNTLATPVAVGLLHPMILVPPSLLRDLSGSELDQVMLHELAHVQRWDDWAHLFQRLVQAALFFNPAVYWVGRQLSLEREMACDERVIAWTQAPRAYASCLAKIVELNLRPPTLAMATGISSGKKDLFERVQTLLDPQQRLGVPASRRRMAIMAIALAALVMAVIQIMPLIALPGRTPGGQATAVYAHTPAPPVPPLPPLPPLPPVPPVSPLAPLAPLPQIAPVPPMPSSAAAHRLAPLPPAATASAARPAATPALISMQQRPADDRLSKASWIRVLKAAAGISSNSEKTAFLIQAAPRVPEDDDVLAAYLSTAAAISGSSQQSEALLALLQHQRLSAAAQLDFLRTTRRIDNNAAKARVLMALLPGLQDTDNVADAFLEATNSIRSASEQRRVLTAFAEVRR